MNQWTSTDNANGQPKWAAQALSVGAGPTARASNNAALFDNATPDAFTHNKKMVVGSFGVSKAEIANTTGEGKKSTAPGWNIRRAWSGPVLAISATNGVGFANGETVLLSNGSVNSTFTLTSNATGNLVSGVLTTPGVFVNSAVVAFTFSREKHLANVIVTGGTAAFTNTDTIRVSNSTINATATISTNSIGGITNASFTITNVGLFVNAKANADVVVAALAANGAVSNGTGATFTATLANSSAGNVAVTTMGGRAGRVHYECLVEHSGLSNGAADDTQLPQ